MANKPWGRPEIPPPEQTGPIVTRFNGWVDSMGSSQKGHYWVKIGIGASELYKALLLSGQQSLILHFEVSAKADVKAVLEAVAAGADDANPRSVDEAIWAALNKPTQQQRALDEAIDWSVVDNE